VIGTPIIEVLQPTQDRNRIDESRWGDGTERSVKRSGRRGPDKAEHQREQAPEDEAGDNKFHKVFFFAV
jgi:hypothetical protein